jgi:hypothetical protein
MDKDKMDELVLSKLDTIIGLLASQGKEPDKQIEILRSLDFTIKQISDVTGLPDGTIKSKMRKKRLNKK